MAITRVGAVVGADSGTTAVTTQDVTIAPTAGNTLVVVAILGSISATCTVAATGGTATFVSRVMQASTVSEGTAFLTASNIGAGISKITVTPSVGTKVMACAIEYSGVDNTTPMDVTPTGGQGANSTAQASASITPVTSGALVLTGLGSVGRSVTTSPFKATTAGPTTHSGTQAGAGWTAERDLWNQGGAPSSLNIVVASNGYTTSGAYQCDWTLAVAGATGLGSIVLRPAAAAAPPVLADYNYPPIAIHRAATR